MVREFAQGEILPLVDLLLREGVAQHAAPSGRVTIGAARGRRWAASGRRRRPPGNRSAVIFAGCASSYRRR
ncbi:MAG: hypothetical protein AB7I38_12130 [Dehalococcoidia bacterium]